VDSLTRIGLITETIEKTGAGLGRYASCLAEQLEKLIPDNLTLIHRFAHSFYEDKRSLRVDIPELKLLSKQILMPLKLRSHQFSLIHDTYHFPPFLLPSASRRVMTVFDVTPLILKTHPLKSRIAHSMLLGVLVRRSDRIITISEHTRTDLMNRFHLRPDHVLAIPLAAAESLGPRPLFEVEAYRAARGLPARYFLSLGTIEPRKNHRRLLEAFSEVAKKDEGVGLVIAGSYGWAMSKLSQLIGELNIGDRVTFLGHIPESELSMIYQGAVALVYPSLYEGFGLPPLEAMQCGCPVITSKTSSLPEVVGGAGLLIDPYSIDDLVTSMLAVLGNEPLRRELISKGVERSKLFSWRRNAERTLEVYEDALTNAP
jgi:glycosyltransferase involved in cell wall biosynthesis